MVQGYPRLKVMMPIDTPWAISYSTSFYCFRHRISPF